MDDRRVTWLRARAVAHRIEAARLDAEADATLAARAAGVSRWAELPPLVLQQVQPRLAPRAVQLPFDAFHGDPGG